MTSFFRFHLFQMKYTLGIQDLRYRIRTTSGLIPKLLALIVPVLLLLAVCAAPYVFVLYLCYELVRVVGSAEHYVTLALFMTQILVLFFALISSFTVMFGRKDHELLSALPIPKRYIYMSTVLHVYASGVLSAALVLIPSMIIYGIGQGFSLQMALMLVPAIVLVPILPVCLAYLFVLLFMRLIAFCPFKEQLATVFGIAFILGYMLFNYSFSAQFGAWFSALDFGALFTDSGWFSTLMNILPGIFLARNTLIGNASEALLSFAMLLVVSSVLFVIMYRVGGKSFFAVRASLTSYAARKMLRVRYKASKPFVAYIKKEFRGLMRSPIYVMNGLLGVMMGPVMLLCFTVGGDLSAMRVIGPVLYAETGEAKWLMIPVLLVLGISYFVSATIAMVPASSYSREGLSRWVTQVVPVSAKDDFMGRMVASLLLFWCGNLFTWGTGWVLFRFSLFEGIFYLIPLLVTSVPCVWISLYIDYKRPKLVWEKEAQAMKQNVNTLFGMLSSWFIAILSMLPLGLYMFDCLNKALCLVLTFAVPVVPAAVSVSVILNKLNRRIVV